MDFENQFSHIAALLGDKARSVMLWCLLDGRAYTATELSLCANISAQSASNHLSKLLEANILSVQKQGRHRYFVFSSPVVAQVVESMAGLVLLNTNHTRMKSQGESSITYARTCYDHLAGKVGVDITNSMIKEGILEPVEKGYSVTALGNEWFQSLDINVEETKKQKRSFAHQCLDWSERRHHLAGALGAVFLENMMKKNWIRKVINSREVLITPIGKLELKTRLGLEV